MAACATTNGVVQQPGAELSVRTRPEKGLRGQPQTIRSITGQRLGRPVYRVVCGRGIALRYIQPGKLNQNA